VCREIDSLKVKRLDSAQAVSSLSIPSASEGKLTPLINTAGAPPKASAFAGSIAIGTSTLKVLISCMNSFSGTSAKKSLGLMDYFSDSIQQLRKSKTVVNVFIHGLLAGYRMEMFYLIFAAWKTCAEKAKAHTQKSQLDTKNCLHHAFSEWLVFATRQRDLSESASAIASEVSYIVMKHLLWS
jgi:hypothetical protein